MASSIPLRIDVANANATDIVDDRKSPFLSKSYSFVHTPLSPSDERPSMDLGRSSSKDNKKTRTESRKLLLHILVQLQTRPMPPAVYGSYIDVKDTARGPNIVDTMKDAMKSKTNIAVRSSSQTSTTEDDSDDDIGLVYSTDDTYELMFQLRNVLLVSHSQGWRIFDDEPNAEDLKTNHSFHRMRSSFQGNRSNSPSPVRGSRIHAPELLMQCVSVLASVVQEDCRYRAPAPRPLRPPNALHALCLDIAQFLIGFHKHNPRVASHVVHAMIPSLSTFPREMHGKLLKFFEQCVIWGPMRDLQVIQVGGGQDIFNESDKIEGDNAPVKIQIVQVDDGSKHDDLGPAILSTNAPSQSRSIYHLSSIVPPLLAAILENVDVHHDQPELHEQFRRVMSAISHLKSDMCSDLLQVVAYHTPQARLLACSALMTSWSTSMGHSVISEPMTSIQINDDLSNAHHAQRHPFSHHFIPWRFPQVAKPNSNNVLRSHCHSCSNLIVDFGLICPLCMCSVHFDCYDYPQGCSLTQYSMGANHEVKKVAMYRFCHAITRGHGPSPVIPLVRSHNFDLLNLFTLCLCFGCRKPLWGCYSQGIGCGSCSIFFHIGCLIAAASDIPPCEHRVIDSNHIHIDWKELRSTFIDYYRHILPTSSISFELSSYEEVTIYLANFWMQLQILANGIALGSIVITQNGEDVSHISQLNKFELHDIIQQSQALLESDSLEVSQALGDYQFENRLSRREHHLMFDWSCLIFIASIIRAPHGLAQTSLASPSFLHAQQSVPPSGHSPSHDSLYSTASVDHVRWILGHELNVVAEPAVHYLLESLSKVGFIHIHGDKSRSVCAFTLPFGFDSSVEAEILVSAIEACLSDEHLSVNEVGFLLLNRRLLPNGMSSEYALKRLARSVLAWLLNEDIAVASILRDFVAKQETLPGVPFNNKTIVWPERPILRPATSSNTNGGDYVAFRRALHSRYSAVWLLSLHDQDPALYAEILYDACMNFEKVQSLDFSVDGATALRSEYESNRHQNILRCIIKLLQASVVYTAFDKLISHWMDSASRSTSRKPMTFLHRVFELERNNMLRSSTSSDSATADTMNPQSLSIDPWRPILTLASQGGPELTRSLDWLDLMASGGVQIPTPHFLHFVSFVSEVKDLANVIALVNAAFKNAWLNPVGRQDLLLVFSKLHVNLSSTIVDAIYKPSKSNLALQFIRRSLASCLVLFGCDRNRLTELGMIIDNEIRGLPPKRKINSRPSSSADPISIDVGMMHALERYVDMNHDDVSRMIATFFNTFFTRSPFVEAYEVDNFILRNGNILAKSSWQLYNIQQPELYEIRASLLSRVIVVDSQPFYDILLRCLLLTTPWEERLFAITKLFRVLQDITNPAFEVEGRNWRSSMTVILYFYFGTLWTDDKEEIRLAVKTSASTLLPAHLQAMESSWVELLLTAPTPERVILTSFLLRVLSFFPRWQVLSWSAITDILSETEGDINNHGSDVDQDIITLRVALLLIGFHMITNGVNVNVPTLLKIKKHLAMTLGFEGVIGILQLDGQVIRVEFGDVTTISEGGTPCIDELTTLFDSPLPFELTPSMMTYSYGQDDKPSKLLVGSLFIDLILVMFCTLKDLSLLTELTLKRILESLCIVVHKHDFASATLLHLQHRLRQAVLRSLELILQDVGYELRQVALSFIQGFVKQCDKFMGHIIYKAIEQIGKLIAAEARNPSDALVAQARVFLEDIFIAYGSSGLFVNLFKRPLTREFFVVVRELFGSMRKDNTEDQKKVLLDEVLPKVVDFDRDSFQVALHNLSTYIEIVYHEGYAADTVKLIGQLLVTFARRLSNEDNVDPLPLLLIPIILSENNPGRISDITPYIGAAVPIIISRTPVAVNTLFRLLAATHGLQRRKGAVVFASRASKFVFDILEDELKSKQKMPPPSLSNLLQLVIHDDDPEWHPLAVTYPSLFLDLIDNALHFLQSYEWPETMLEDAYAASLSAATVVWYAVDRDTRTIEKLVQLGSEKFVSTDYRIRAWNMIVMGALKYSKKGFKKFAVALIPFLEVFSNVQFNALRAYTQSEASNWDYATANINHAYIAIKLWIMLSCEISTEEIEGISITTRVWNELWPPFESLAFNAEKQNDIDLGIALLISSSVADLFVFLHSLRTPLSSQTTLHIATLDRLKSMTGTDAANRKVTRAIHSLSQPPTSLPLEMLVNQTSKEIIAAEKLRVLESKKEIRGQTDPRRPGVDRFRRDVRLPT